MDSKKRDFTFFIITENGYLSALRAGNLCYTSEDEYNCSKNQWTSMYAHILGYKRKEHVKFSDVSVLTPNEAELLYGLEQNDDRQKWFQEIITLNSAVALAVDTAVTVEGHGEDLQGIIRYIGPLTDTKFDEPISGTFFGIELQGKDKGKGQHDGTFKTKSYFRCQKNDGLFVPFSRIRPVSPPSPTTAASKAPSQAPSHHIEKGAVVNYVGAERQGVGVVMGMGEEKGEKLVHILTNDGELTVPMNCVSNATAEDKESIEEMDTGAPLVDPQAQCSGPGDALGLDSLVELSLNAGLYYGVIRWIGSLPERPDVTMCGVELDEEKGVSDGQFKGKRYFSCPPKKALFVKLATCRPDQRFSSHPAASAGQNTTDEEEEAAVTDRPIEAINTNDVERLLIGRMKGIQGHCNSCYMDATLFSLFSCSSVLDSLLFKTPEAEDSAIQSTLLHNIVNPLRREGFVEGKHIMKLRQQLLKHGYSHTFTTDEKDPEEFLTIIMQHVIALEPLLKLSAGGKVQESYCYQIFLDQNHSLVLPTVQQLLEHSFHSAGLKLAESPYCLILQMPRFGKKFKMFDKIVPSLVLEVNDLLTEGPQQCMICGQLARVGCTECFRDPVFSQTGFKVFCKDCSSQVHSHPQRKAHVPSALQLPKQFNESEFVHTAPDRLELFAVLCIETSHYVSFVKHGPRSQDWIFFDSMADREGGLDGYNIPQIHACPEVGEYLDMPLAELANQQPRDMKGVAKRLFCDAYMYLYRNNALAMYR